ncbi:MAG: DUF1542 domain-containing protein, partial [Lactobacillus sp.]|nr:DUF1542 domain-containing protein [Lactobacillus sp.]
NGTIASNQAEETETAEVASSPIASDATANVNDSVLPKNANQDVANAGVTPRADVSGSANTDYSVQLSSIADEYGHTVANDVEKAKKNTELNEQDNKQYRDTSNEVPIPSQITNPDSFKLKVATVSTFEDLVAAWADNKVTYINIVADISNEKSNLKLGQRTGRGNVVVNGNGHKINMGGAAFGYVSTNLSVEFALTNATIIQTGTVYNLIEFKDANSATNTSGSPNAQIYIDNVTAEKIDGPMDWNFVGAYQANLVLSGNNHIEGATAFNASSLGTLKFANDASLVLKTVPRKSSWGETNTPFSLYNFTGKQGIFSMGDRSSLNIYEDQDSSTKKAAFSGVDKLIVGNDVTWTQHGWGAFIDTERSQSTINAFFGERFTLNQDIISAEGISSIRLRHTLGGMRGAKVTFNAGTTLNIKSNSAGNPIFYLYSEWEKYDEDNIGTPTVTLNSPRELNMSYCDEDGDPLTPTVPIIMTHLPNRTDRLSGVFKINGLSQPLNLWTGNNVSTTPDRSINQKCDTLKIRERTSLYDSAGSETVISDLFPENIRAMQLKNNGVAEVGSSIVQYVDQNGNVLKKVNLSFTDKGNFVGQRFYMLDEKKVVDEMPSGYNLAYQYNTSQIYPGAKIDPEGMLTNRFGQALYGYVPGKTATQEQVYNIYIWGAPQTVKYQYVDINHKERGALPAQSQTVNYSKKDEAANTGNVIDWTADRFKAPIPRGYHYYVEKNGENIQPKSTIVGSDNPLVTIYVEGDEKTVDVQYLDTVNMTNVYPSTPVSIRGRVGDTVYIPDAPDIPGYIFARATNTNASGPALTTIDIGIDNPQITYWYTNLANILGKYKDIIRDAQDIAKSKINADDTITQDEKTAYIRSIDNIYVKYIDKLNAAKTLDQCDQAVSDAKSEFQYIVDQKGLDLETQKENAKAKIDQALAAIKQAIDADKNLTSAEKTDIWSKLSGPTATSAKNAIEAATNADKLSTALEKGVNDVQTYTPEFTLAKRKENAKADLSDKFKLIQPIKNTIDSDPTLSADEKAAQKAAIDSDIQQGTADIDKAWNADEVVKLLEDWINTIKSEYKPGGNGSGSNGSGSNGSGSNGSGSNGSGSNGSDSNGSDSNGSGSNGSDSNGSGSNGSDSNGSGSNGSESNGSDSNGSGSNGSESNGSDSNGSGSNGSESNGSESNGSDSNGSESNGSDSNGSGSNGSDS